MFAADNNQRRVGNLNSQIPLLPSEEKLSRCGGGQNSQKVKRRFFKSLEKSEYVLDE